MDECDNPGFGPGCFLGDFYGCLQGIGCQL